MDSGVAANADKIDAVPNCLKYGIFTDAANKGKCDKTELKCKPGFGFINTAAGDN